MIPRDNYPENLSSLREKQLIKVVGRKISVHTVENYLRALTDSFIFYQVAYTVIDTDGKTLARELAPPDTISDHNAKYLLTMDLGPLVSHNGIKQINVLDWLLK